MECCVGALYHGFTFDLVRLCQFHVIQAILRWSTDTDVQVDPSATPKISKAAQVDILIKFREIIQRFRCIREADEDEDAFDQRREEEWDLVVDNFLSKVDIIVELHAKDRSSKTTSTSFKATSSVELVAHTRRIVRHYFLKNWLGADAKKVWRSEFLILRSSCLERDIFGTRRCLHR